MGRLYDATCGRLFAAGYDWMLGDSERAGLAALRRDLVARAAGATVEVGAGTGLNLSYYPDTVTELVLTEPSAHMARRLRARRTELGRQATVVEARAERLPFAEASFDTVVTTLVLCTVPEVAATLAEIRRVLRPDGRLLVLEHVRSVDPRLARWQDRSGGCSAPAVTATATSRAPSKRAGSAWSGALLGRCRRPHRSSDR